MTRTENLLYQTLWERKGRDRESYSILIVEVFLKAILEVYLKTIREV